MQPRRSLPIRSNLIVAFGLLLSGAAFGQTNTVPARVTQPVDMRNVVTLRGNVHPLARPEFDQGVAPDDLPMERMLLVLKRSAQQETALRQLLDDQQTTSSSRFHQWLSPIEFGGEFGPADADVQAVTDWLTSQGFTVAKVAAGRTVIEFSGSAGLVRQVLGTEIHRYRVNGEDHWANASDPQIPAALAPVVAGFASLNNFPIKPLVKSLGTFTRSKLTGLVQPALTIPEPCTDGGTGCYDFPLGPADFGTIYNVTPLWLAATNGAGQIIAVVGETNINLQDVAGFRTMFGLSANVPNIILNGPDPGITSFDETEADLDVQWSGAVATGATIDLVVSESTEATAGIDLSALYIIDNNLAPVMSESYGACEADLGTGGNIFHSMLWEQGAAEGITVLMAAGDSGPAGCDSANQNEVAAQYGLAVSGFASTPFNVAVGGTDFDISSSNVATYWSLTNSASEGSAKSYIPEITWNDSCADAGILTGCNPPPNINYLNDGLYLLAGAGGPSNCSTSTGQFPSAACTGYYAKPSWQSGLDVPNDGARDIPDLALFAGNGFHGSFYVICQMDANASTGGNTSECNLSSPYTDFQGGSGTSAAVQTFAGIMAMINQRYGRQGNANYVLYPLAAQNPASCNSLTTAATNSTCIFYDITSGNNSVICQGGSPNCSSTTSGQYGVAVSGGAPAYSAAVGYDLATGLGSINAQNLLSNWKSNFTASSVSLSLSTNPATNPPTITHGQAMNYTIHVSSSGGTPAGDVSLIADTSTSGGVSSRAAIGPFTLSSGTASGSTLMLPGGSYSVTAHFPGNGTDAAADSSPGVSIVVNPEASKTLLQLVTYNPTSGEPSYGSTSTPYGYPYIMRVDVTNSSGQWCAPSNSIGEQFTISYPCPTGKITVTPAPAEQNPPPGTVPGTYTLNTQGYAEDQFIQLAPGQYSFAAAYGGDSSYTASSYTAPTITVTPGATSVALTNLPASEVNGTSDNITATLTTAYSGGAAPAGNIEFKSNGSSLGTAALSNVSFNNATSVFTEQATLVSTLAAGVDSVTASYSGDANYASSTSPASSITVTDFSISASPSPVTIASPGQSGTSTITIAPQNGFTGSVNLSVTSGCPADATCTLSVSPVTVSTSSATSILTVATVGASRTPFATWRITPPGGNWLIDLLGLFATLLVLGALLALPAIRQRPALFVAAASLAAAGLWAACGGGGGSSVSSPAPTPTPAVLLSPTSLTFSPQNMDTSSAPQNVSLTNNGTAQLTISSISLVGTNPGDFSQSNTCGGGLAVNGNCSISITFTPAAAGTRNASVSIADNATGTPQTVGLTGAGVSQPTPTGTYPVAISATSGSDQHSLTVNVTVQ